MQRSGKGSYVMSWTWATGVVGATIKQEQLEQRCSRRKKKREMCYKKQESDICIIIHMEKTRALT